MKEFLEVVTFHLPRFKNTVKMCKTRPGQVILSDLTFAMMSVATYVFLKMKGFYAMTYQYLMVAWSMLPRRMADLSIRKRSRLQTSVDLNP